MLRERVKKLTASILMVAITFANISVLANGVYAADSELEQQGVTTNNSNVEFDSYFLGENGEKRHQIVGDLNKDDLILYFSIKVKQGYLKTGSIQANANEKNANANFNMQQSQEDLNIVREVKDNKVTLNQIASGAESVIAIPIKAIKEDSISLANFNQENRITFSGKYVNNEGKEIDIKKEISLQLTWTAENKVLLQQEITNYVPFANGEKKGVMLGTMVTVGLENNSMPIGKQVIKITVPKIQEEKIDSLAIVSEGKAIAKENYQYDSKTNTLIIQENNLPNEQNIISWKKAPKQYEISYIYGENTYNKIGKDEITIEQKTEANLTTYGSAIVENKTENILSQKVKEQIGGIVGYQVGITEAANKGYLYTNTENQKENVEKLEKKYQTKQTVSIHYSGLVDGIQFMMTDDKFVSTQVDNKTKEEKEILTDTNFGTIHNTYYQKTIISKQDFDTFFGPNGWIEIQNNVGEVIAKIDNKTEADEQGNFVITYENQDTDIIRIVTSKPVQEGNFTVQHVKAIKGEVSYTKEEEKTFEALRTFVNGEATLENSNIAKAEVAADMKLEEPITKVDIEMNKTSFSTIAKNEGIELKAILRTDKDNYDLFQNPCFEIEMPSYVQNVQLKQIQLLFNEENKLAIQNYEVVTGENGRQFIRVTLTGKQTGYMLDAVTKGVNLYLKMDLTLDKLSPNKTENINITYTNELATQYENGGEKGSSSIETRAVAPDGIVNISTIADFNEQGESITSVKQGEVTGKIETHADAKNAKMTLTVINNTGVNTNGITLLGRTPFKGNKSIVSSQDLGTTIDGKMLGAIRANGLVAEDVEIYYSENGEANRDLKNSNNGWTTSPADYTKVKSYLIVVNNKTLAQGESIQFEYNFEIPENLSHNNNLYGTFATYYQKQVLTRSNNQDVTEADKVGLTTGEGPEVKLEIYPENRETTLKEGAIVDFKAKITNTGKVDVTGASFSTVQIPDGATYVVYKTTDETDTSENGIAAGHVGFFDRSTISESPFDLKAGETKEISFKVRMKDLEGSAEKKIKISANITADNLEGTITAASNELTITKADFFFYLIGQERPDLYYQGGTQDLPNNANFTIRVTNHSDREIKNVTFKMMVPKNLKNVHAYRYINEENETEEGSSYNPDTGELNFKIGTLASKEGMSLHIQGEVIGAIDGQVEQDIVLKSTLSGTGTEEYTSNTIVAHFAKVKLSITKEADVKEEYVSIGQEINYTITVKNESNVYSSTSNVVDYVPEGLAVQEVKYQINDGEWEEGYIADTNIVSVDYGLEPEDVMTIKIKTIVEGIEGREEDLNIKNTATVTNKQEEEEKSDDVDHIIEPDENPDDPNAPVYKIRGTAWLDSNKDGKRDENESTLSGIRAILIDNNTKQYVTSETGERLELVSDQYGEYQFEKLKKGSYQVVFIYNADQYGLTTYQKQGVDSNLNSDAVGQQIKLDGQVINAAITDTITIDKISKGNIDIGLIETDKFDLSLDKSVQKVTVQNSKTTKTYEYNNSKLAKVDLDYKNINGTNVIIEYNVTVKNEGKLAGYAKKVTDYLPKGLKFDANMNPDWYIDSDGNASSIALSNTKLEPGESKTLKLVLIKTVNGEDLDIINNNVEIAEDYNENNVADYNSTPGNKNTQENDYSSADVMLSLKTGRAILYVGIILAAVGTICTGIYFIKKKVLD